MADIAIVRGAAAYHGRTFAGIINQYDQDAYREKKWPAYPTALAGRAHVTHVWDPDRKAAEELAAAANIDNVADTPEEIIGQVDGVLIADDGTRKHQQAALPFLKACVPTFVDKPLSTDADEARRIIEAARANGTPFFSSSALRFATEIQDRRALADKVGEITTICGVGVNELIFYGVHPLEAIVTLMGPGIASVRNVGQPGEAVVRLRFKDGRQAVMIVYEKGFGYTLELTIHGTKGHLHVPFMDSAGFYTNMLSAFLDMVETGKPPFPAEDTLEIIKALVLAKQSVAEGGAEELL
jgi:predicted dehydrogenase